MDVMIQEDRFTQWSLFFSSFGNGVYYHCTY